MESIKAIIIDDDPKYRTKLGGWLESNGVNVMETFTHNWFINYATLTEMPHVAVVSLKSISDAKITVAFLRENFPAIRILLNSDYEEWLLINKEIGKRADGIVYKFDDDQYKIINALKILGENKK